MCDIFARPRPGRGDRPATAVRTPFRDNVPAACRILIAAAFMLGAIARDTLGDPGRLRALHRALDLTEPDQALPLSLIHPPPGLLDRHARHHSADAALICDAADLLARMDRLAPPPGRQSAHHVEALSRGEVRVLRYLQTNLSAREIAGELSITVNTVKTHQRHLHQKLGARSRTQAVEQARALGLLTPSARATNTESQRYDFQL
jgi:LuxR family maltose regulon positive regulatory protein